MVDNHDPNDFINDGISEFVDGKDAPVEVDIDEIDEPKADPAPVIEDEFNNADDLTDVHNDGSLDGEFGRVQNIIQKPLEEVIAEEQEAEVPIAVEEN